MNSPGDTDELTEPRRHADTHMHTNGDSRVLSFVPTRLPCEHRNEHKDVLTAAEALDQQASAAAWFVISCQHMLCCGLPHVYKNSCVANDSQVCNRKKPQSFTRLLSRSTRTPQGCCGARCLLKRLYQSTQLELTMAHKSQSLPTKCRPRP